MKKGLSTLMTVLFLTGVSFAQMPEQPQPCPEGNMPPQEMCKQNPMKKGFEEIAKEINLTDEQKQQIEAMAKADREKKKEIKDQIKENFKAIDAELLKENYDVNVVNNLTAEIQSLQGKMAKMNIDSKIQMRSILSYDQFKQVEKIRQDKRNRAMNEMKQMREMIQVSTETVKATVAASTETVKEIVATSTETAKTTVAASTETAKTTVTTSTETAKTSTEKKEKKSSKKSKAKSKSKNKNK